MPDDYPINHHVLAEDFRAQKAGDKTYNQGDGEWLHDSLIKMCDAYDEAQEEIERLRGEWRKADDGWIAAKAELGFWVVGVTEECRRLAICQSQEQAEQYVGALPEAEDGRYYIDGPCFEVIELRVKDGDKE
jgi:hypothetical protein